MNHYTDQAGYHGIRAQSVWLFRAAQPPGNHPFGAYFTTLPRTTRNLAQRLRIPKSKTRFVFEFTDAGDLLPLPGGRGDYVFYFPRDYDVTESRQQYHGPT
ncbi:MAG: hypothetical protein JNM56_23420 [Planctomycetia bacterium]|nr:hypothetical protein [Planctomycetia bacterium]